MKKYLSNNRYHRKTGPDYSESFSNDVTHSILVSPTDTWQALNESAAKLANPEQRAKNNILKFLNGDFDIKYNVEFPTLRQQLRKLFSFRLVEKSDYVKYHLNDGRIVAFRFANHNAFGDNFEQDNADLNISVYVRPLVRMLQNLILHILNMKYLKNTLTLIEKNVSRH